MVLQQSDPSVVLSRAHALVDELAGLDLTGLSEDELLGLWREFERLRRRLPSVEHTLVLEAEGRGLPETYQAPSSGAFLRGLLRPDPREAAGRVKGARRRCPPVVDHR